MKCVCPMGGDRTCPDDCPLAVWASLSAADRKAQRKSVAERLYKQGFTMEQIATQLGVSQSTITEDLRNLSKVDKLKSAKTASNPKGAGRPKGSKREGRRGKVPTPVLDEARKIISPKLDAGEPINFKKLEEEHGIAHVTFDMAKTAEVAYREGKADVDIDAAMLSMTAQQKLETAIRQHRKKLQSEFEQAVQYEYQKRVNEMGLPLLKQLCAEARKIMDARRGFMTKETFNTIRRALHPDSRGSISDHKLGQAFDEFMRLEKYLLAEKDSPTTYPTLPRDIAEWDAMKKQATAERKAKRNSKQQPTVRH